VRAAARSAVRLRSDHDLPDRGQSLFEESRVQRGGRLHVWGKDLSVFPQVYVECITLPTSFDPNNLEGDVSQEVLQGRADPDAMPAERLLSCVSQGV